MNRRGETGKNERVEKEDRAKNRSRADEDIARIGTERCLEHAASERAAETAFLRLLKHDDHRQKDADQHLYHIKKPNENCHFAFLSFIGVYYT